MNIYHCAAESVLYTKAEQEALQMMVKAGSLERARDQWNSIIKHHLIITLYM